MMKRVLFNFVTANTGGVIDFKRSVARALNEVASEFSCELYISYSADDFGDLSKFEKIKFISLPYIPKKAVDKIKFYERDLERILRSNDIDVVVNFGDIPARTRSFQIFYFDWPYAVYNDWSLWSKMRLNDLLSKSLKRIYFSITRNRPNRFIAQTQTMKRRLSQYVPEPKIEVIDVGFNASERDVNQEADFSSSGRDFIYPTAIYPHKNIYILADAAARLKKHSVVCTFVLTFDGTEGREEGNFVSLVNERRLEDYFEFTGRLSRIDLVRRMQQARAIIMPTLIETYGLPYLEAQVLKKAMLTSDRDFARELFGEAAVYFDPLDPEDVAQAVRRVIEDPVLKERLEEASARNLEARIEWSDTVRLILEQTEVPRR